MQMFPRLVIVVVFTLNLPTSMARAAVANDWEALSADDFAVRAERYLASASPDSAAEIAEIAWRRFFGDPQFAKTATPAVIARLTALFADLRPDGVEQSALVTLQETLRGRIEREGLGLAGKQLDQLSLPELLAGLDLAVAAGQPGVESADSLRSWIAARGVESLSVDELQACLDRLQPLRSGLNKFNVTWSGLVTPPRTGDYVFSVSPINVNQRGPQETRHSISVSIGGQEVLKTPSAATDSTIEVASRARSAEARPSDEWMPRGQAVALAANEPVPFRVEMTYSCAGTDASCAPHAVLSWEGPALRTQVVPGASLAGPAGEDDVTIEYRWKEGAEQRVVRHQVASVDFVVATPAVIAPPNHRLLRTLADQLHAVATSEAYFDDCLQADIKHVFIARPELAMLLTSRQRDELATELAMHTDVLSTISANEIVRLYECIRFGAEDAALDAVGQWMLVHGNDAPKITLDFFVENRFPYWLLGRLMADQLPSHLELLRDRYLADDDTPCPLPVAYTLTYGYLDQSTVRPDPRSERRSADHRYESPFALWRNELQQIVVNEGLSGDQRLNWLIALAHAEEAVAKPDLDHPYGREFLFSGREWLDECRLIAETASAQERVLQEWIARLAARRMWDGALDFAASAESRTVAGDWERTIRELRAEDQRLLARQEAAVAADRIAEFERRMQRAKDRDDSAAAARYAAHIDLLNQRAEEQESTTAKVEN